MIEISVYNFKTRGERRATKVIGEEDRAELYEGNEKESGDKEVDNF